MAGFAEGEGGIGEIVLRAGGDAGLVFVEVEVVARGTDSRPFVESQRGGDAAVLGRGVVVEEGEGWVDHYVVACAAEK